MSMEFRHIVRMLGKDLDGNSNIAFALTKIKGINIRLANAILKKANIQSKKRLGFLSDAESRRIEEALINIEQHKLPAWLLNRRKDIEAGVDVHLTTSDLDLQLKGDIEKMVQTKSWRGYRHAYGLRVRGQRTRTTNRKTRSMGVKKRRVGTSGGS